MPLADRDRPGADVGHAAGVDEARPVAAGLGVDGADARDLEAVEGGGGCGEGGEEADVFAEPLPFL